MLDGQSRALETHINSLVSSKNLSCGWGPGPGNLDQKCYDITHKNSKSKLSNFLKIETRKHAASSWGFEQLPSSNGWQGM